MLKRLSAVIQKEFIHIFRDVRSLLVILALPILMLLLYGNMISLDPNAMSIGFVDLDHSQSSRQLVEKFKGSGFFKIRAVADSPAKIESMLQSRAVKAVVVIPADFEKRIARDPSIPIQLVADASDSNSASLITNYVGAIALNFSLAGTSIRSPIDIRTRMLYNPDGKTMYYILPGIATIIMLMISALLPCLTLVKEKETGTLEQILVTPLSSAEIVLGKIAPYMFLAFLDGLLVLGSAYLIYQMPFRGSLPLLLSLCLLFVLTGLSLGLLISSRVKSQQVAIMGALALTMMPTMILSGFMFPLESMPAFLQGISRVIPASYFLVIIRGILVKGIGFEHLVFPTLFLVFFTLFVLGISILSFKPRLD
ncbi:MAG TPA: ABC transporter permease [Cyanobacteria bacterium UBA8530]|nr:ABC transporter permease [Cyanobacteria bacterium UBA8530]